jgi:hypothetical protein
MTAEESFDTVRVWPMAHAHVLISIRCYYALSIRRKDERCQEGNVAQDRLGLVIFFVLRVLGLCRLSLGSWGRFQRVSRSFGKSPR